MAYFDNPERRDEWEKELAALRAEKQARKEGSYIPPATDLSDEKAAEVTGSIRERISYAELLMEENLNTKSVTKTAPQREIKKEVQLGK